MSTYPPSCPRPTPHSSPRERPRWRRVTPRTRSRRVASRLPRRETASALARRASAPAPLVPTRTTPSSSGVGGFLRKPYTGELGAPASGPGSDAAAFAGSESAECAMSARRCYRHCLARELVLAYDASRDGWSAARFTRGATTSPRGARREDREGPLLRRVQPLGWASREDYRDAFNAFLVKWPRRRARGRRRALILEKVGGPARPSSTSARRAPSSARRPEDPARPRAVHGSPTRKSGARPRGREGDQTAKSSLGSSYRAPGRHGDALRPEQGRETEPRR